MTDNKLTDNEIIKALEESISFDEPYESDFTLIRIKYIKDVLGLINRLQAENERLRATIDSFTDIGKLYSEIRTKAYKECIEKVKALFPSDNEPYQYWEIHEGADNLLKELVGESDG